MGEDHWIVAHVRHHQGVGLAWRSGRYRVLCRERRRWSSELEALRHAFDRNANGTVYQRPFGGHMQNSVQARRCSVPAVRRTAPATRCCTRLYQRNVRASTRFLVEWMALDLIRDASGQVLGVTAMEMETERCRCCRARSAVRHRSAGRIYSASTNAFINTGDGLGMRRAPDPARRHGILAIPSDRRGRRGVLITKAYAARAVTC